MTNSKHSSNNYEQERGNIKIEDSTSKTQYICLFIGGVGWFPCFQ